jgi:mRNA interferase HigB
MKIVGLQVLSTLCDNHRDCSQQVSAWLIEARDAIWRTPSDIKQQYASTSFLQNNHVIFNIKGNKYRIDTKIYFQRQMVMIIRAGTHEEYKGWMF